MAVREEAGPRVVSMRPREIALMYARTCNIACRHCGIESSPRVKSRMRLEDAQRFIIEAAAIPRFGKVTFTGGEPLLFQEEHLELISLCTKLGLQTRVVTNGFWARNPQKGLALLSRLRAAGLSELNFSADKYHLEFLDASILRNALECARQLGYARIVSFVTNSDTPPLDLFSDLYDIPRETLDDLRRYAGDPAAIDAVKDSKILVYSGGLIGLGRAAEHPDELRHFPVDTFPREPCGEVVNKPVIYPDGDFQACCCAGGKIKSFTVGNLHRSSLVELYATMEARPHYRFINDRGPRELFEAVARARPDLPLQTAPTSICEVCVKAVHDLDAGEVDAIVEGALVERTLLALRVIPSRGATGGTT